MSDFVRIAFAYAPPWSRDELAALWAYDAALGRTVATTSVLMIGQMRLTWWYDRLSELETANVPAEPLIAALHEVTKTHDVTGPMLAALVEGWEALLEPVPLTADTLRSFAVMRGDRLFDLSSRILGGTMNAGVGAGWALIDLATHISDRPTGELAWKMAGEFFETADLRVPKPLRILARVARAQANQPFAMLSRPVSRWTMLRAVL